MSGSQQFLPPWRLQTNRKAWGVKQDHVWAENVIQTSTNLHPPVGLKLLDIQF